MGRVLAAIIAVVIVLGLWLVTSGEAKPTGGKEIIVLCGGSMRAALEELKVRYEKVSGDKVMPTYGGSGELCAQIQKTGRGDLYLCHDPFMPWAKDQGLISEWKAVASLKVVIAVPKDNPKKISGLDDLAKPDVRLGIGNQTYSTSGNIAKYILKKHPQGAKILANVRVETKGHQQRCNDIVMGTLDAGLVWDAVAHLYPEKLKIIPIPDELLDVITTATYDKSDLRNTKVTLGIISGARDRKAARDFYKFATTEGLKVFGEFGFSPPTE